MSTAATPSAWRNRILRSGDAALSEIVANPANWRTHPRLQADALSSVLADVGYVQQVIINARSGRLVDGHLCVERRYLDVYAAGDRAHELVDMTDRPMGSIRVSGGGAHPSWTFRDGESGGTMPERASADDEKPLYFVPGAAEIAASARNGYSIV